MAIALTEQPTSVPFDGSLLWHRTAPRRLVERWSAADTERRWTLWQRYLARRKRPRQPLFLVGKRPPLLWCWPDAWQRSELATTGEALTNCVELMLDLPDSDRPSTAPQAVGMAYALPELAAELPGDVWWQLTETLHQLATDAQQLQVDLADDPQQIVRQQLLAGELPLALSYLFPELAPLLALRKPARQSLSESLVALTDGRGMPHARLLPVLGPLMACWTRARWLGHELKRGCWSSAAESQYEWLVRCAARLVDGGHRFLLAGEPTDEEAGDLRALLSMTLELAGDEADCAAAAAAVSRSVVPVDADFDDDDLPKASLHSEWAGVAVLSGSWSKSAPRLAVAYADDSVTLELHVGGQQVLAGKLIAETTCDGRPVAAVGSWEEVCWQSDEDCDYLELSLDLADGLSLERQILLAKEDHVLYLADIVLAGGHASRELWHSLGLPLGRDAVWQPLDETRDGVLAAGKRRVAVLPLALGEWRSDPRGGELEVDDRRLTLTQRATGLALCCPLMFDLKSARSRKERTWRQLTVAEALAVVPRDVAVGFRAQSGRDQWLYYRSLAAAGNRTMMGQNISSEFLAGRFLTTGELDEWIEIEAEP